MCVFFYPNIPDSGNTYSHADSECYIFNSTPAFFFTSRFAWLHWVTEHPHVPFTTPGPEPASAGSGHLSDTCGSVQRKVSRGGPPVWSLEGCTFCWWHWLSCPPSYCAVLHRGVHAHLLVASCGRQWRWGLEEDIDILIERVCSPVGPS